NIVPNAEPARKVIDEMQALGCKFWPFRSGIFEERITVGYCNGEALKILLSGRAGRPRAFVWFNCMTWTTENEIKAIKRTLITHVGFVSGFQKRTLLERYQTALRVKRAGSLPFKILKYSPWLDLSRFHVLKKSNRYFGVGRISRNDPAKFS